ncbi:MAG: hypothetical protein ACK5F6_00500 [Bacteroidota bacterium]|jgi:hypothetical protein
MKRKQLGIEIDSVVFPAAENKSNIPKDYIPFSDELKLFIRNEKFSTILNSNQRMILM